MDSSLIIHAPNFAAFKHRNQRRKDADASPYINHPLALANVLCNEAGITDSVVICAALLHDTIEDTETTFAELQVEFGIAIASVVMARLRWIPVFDHKVTDDKKLAKAERKRLQITHARTASRRARLVKLADKICNLRDLATNPPASWKLRRKRKYFDWSAEVIDALRGTNRKLEKLFDEASARRP
jgi:guanosine-3',5'-bis(diphosphate) 3'-pyrophosphohydrolase